jgi:hypothetical protein
MWVYSDVGNGTCETSTSVVIKAEGELDLNLFVGET